MSDQIYRVIAVVGSSGETRAHVEDGRIAHFQVTLKVGFTIGDRA